MAAIVVIWYHVFEGFATSSKDQILNHGYLAVDFFFMLSGFVIGYAYDCCWREGRMTVREFLRRRVVRLHPMLVIGVVMGVLAFAIQGLVKWDETSVSGISVALAAILSIFMIPAYPGAGYEVRGNGECFPLNGPAWSLFFEYIGSAFYALWIRRLSSRWLGVIVAVSGAGLLVYATGNMSGTNHLGVGWSLGDWNFLGGMLRLMFSFTLGLLMSRGFRPMKVRGAFWICSFSVVGLLCVPFIGWSPETQWLNGLYDAVVVIFLFPAVLYVGASGTTTDRHSTAACNFLGRVSYPVYIIHYPLIYLFYAWVWSESIRFGGAWPVALGVFFTSIVLAVLLKYYYEPLRRRLSRSGAKKGLKIIRPWVLDQLSKVLSILDTSVCNCFSSGRRSSMLLQA